MSTSAQIKKDCYSHRNDSSVNVPIGIDSDSDFNPGEYIPDEMKNKKKKRKSHSSPDKLENKRRRKSAPKREELDSTSEGDVESEFSDMSDADDLEDISTSRKRKKTQGKTKKRKKHLLKDPKRMKGRDWGVNPLLRYFDHPLDSSSSSEENGDEESDSAKVYTSIVPARRRPHAESEPEEPTSSDRERIQPRSDIPSSTKSIPNNTKPPDNRKDDDSDTESESDTFPEPLPSKKPEVIDIADAPTESESEGDDVFNHVNPQPKHTRNIEDETTESESDNDDVFDRFLPKPAPPEEEESDTEDEDEDEDDIVLDPRPKPAFPLPSPLKYPLGPHILDAEKEIRIPGPINTYLRSYQREGVEFLYRQFKEDMGGVLGDDMGLGKTVQVIAFLSAIMSKTGTRRDEERRRKHVLEMQDKKAWRKKRQLPPADSKWPTALIIAPSTVVWNWEREFRTWGYFEVGCYMGKSSLRAQVLKDFVMGRLDVVITSHDLARMDIEEFDSLPWSVIFVDEAHKVKNPNSQITRLFHHFRCLKRFGLTGTAIQNSYNELYTVLDWVNPDSLGTKRDWKTIVNLPLTKGQSKSAGRDERRKFLTVSQVLSKRLLPRFFLRRTKKLIENQMPKKYDQVVFCGLAPKQVEIYKNIISHDRVVNILRKKELCDCGSREQRQHCCHPWDRGDVFYFISLLIKLSNHICLILPGDPHDTIEQTESAREVCREFAFPGEKPPKFGKAQMMSEYCGKWEALQILLTDWRAERGAKNKVLIFTKSVKLITILSWHLDRCGFKHLRLDGSVKQEDRMPMIDKFHEDEDVFVFLISTMAGGTGLNLTGANKVVIFDPNWNPAHDLQAMDRAFRFGQRRDVHVYRLLGAGSLEELIYARQVYKQQQMAIGYDGSIQTRYFEGVQDDPSQPGELFGLNNIFKLDEKRLSTKLCIEQAQVANVDWTLMNSKGSGGKKESVNGSKNENVEVGEVVDNKADSDLRGLGALLFDDAPPDLTRKKKNVPKTEEDEINQKFNEAGVKYTHYNDQMLVPSAKEMKQAEEDLKPQKRKRKSIAAKPAWPPHRPVKKKKTDPRRPPKPEEELTPMQRFHRRLATIGHTGHHCFRTPQEASQFAAYFSSASPEKQQDILNEMDAGPVTAE